VGYGGYVHFPLLQSPQRRRNWANMGCQPRTPLPSPLASPQVNTSSALSNSAFTTPVRHPSSTSAALRSRSPVVVQAACRPQRRFPDTSSLPIPAIRQTSTTTSTATLSRVLKSRPARQSLCLEKTSVIVRLYCSLSFQRILISFV
jgi:hypothetical protein